MGFDTQLRKRRTQLGFSLQAVADQLAELGVPVTRAALSKYETGKSMPRATVLRALTRVLDCSASYLLATPATTVEWLRFRKKTTLRRKTELQIKETARQWLEARLLVDDALGASEPEYDLESVRVAALDEAEKLAGTVRLRWSVGDWPIESVSAALERSGVAVIDVEADGGLDGISGVADGEQRFVVVSAATSTDRMRMNLAHEFGHTMIEATADESFDEKAAFRFAAALLMPADVLRRRVGARRTTIDLGELLLLKEEYGISIQALIRRCLDTGIIGAWAYRQLNIELRTRGWHRNEPGRCAHLEGATRLRSGLLRCMVEGLLSEDTIRSRFPDAAKTIGTLDGETLWEWRDLRTAPRSQRDRTLEVAAQRSRKDYQPGGSLHGLEIIDGEA